MKGLGAVAVFDVVAEIQSITMGLCHHFSHSKAELLQIPQSALNVALNC